MLNYVIRRLLIGLLTLLMITFVIFGLIRNMPGDPLSVELAEMDPSVRINEQDYERMKRAYGLDKPWPQAYLQWVSNLARWDLGRSITYKQSVTKIIGERIGPTLILTGTSLVLAYLLSIPLGLYATARHGRPDQQVTGTLLYMLYSLPSYVAALFMQLVFYAKLGWLPVAFMTSDDYEQLAAVGKAWDVFQHALMPTLCLTYGSLAYYSRFVHANMQEAIRQDYIRTAKAKGVAPRRIIVHHAFRNTMIPLITLLGLSLPSLLSGAVIIEQIFSWPGMGRLFFESILRRDYPIIMGLTFMFSILTLVGQLLADLLYAVADPRISYS
jgi:peptide/nickel transport system permease protein